MLMTALEIIWEYRVAFGQGLLVTLQMSAIIWLLGIGLGTLLGWYAAGHTSSVGRTIRVVAFVLSGVPTIVFLFWLHYPAQAMAGEVIDPFYTAVLTFVILNIIGVSDIVRGALEDFPKHYAVAARVCGMSERQTFRYIQLPLLLRGIIPGLLMLQITMLHTTLFASLISVEEVFRVAQRINAMIYKPVEIYTALGIFFLCISLPVNGLAIYLKNRFTRDVSER